VTIRVSRVLNRGMPTIKDEAPAIGIIGGSGLYQIEELRDATEHKVDTPFGSPSDVLVGGKLSGRRVYFLPRHGRGHRILPHEINHRANIYALRSLNVRWIISVAAVGSLQEKYAPRDLVLPSQFYDRTSQRAIHTFFGEGIAAHVGFAEPISANLRNLVAESARSLGVTVHNGGIYVNMDGPAFSTRAESEFNRRNGFDVIAMTNLPEAKLARDDGDDHRLRLLEGGGGTGLGANGPQSFVSKCRDREKSDRGCDPANTRGAELAGTLRIGHCVDHRPQALAGSYGRKTQTNLRAVSVATALWAVQDFS